MKMDLYDDLTGQLLATQVAIRGLILALGDQADAAVQTELQRWIASAIQSELSDEFYAGMEKAKKRLLPSGDDWQRYQQGRSRA